MRPRHRTGSRGGGDSSNNSDALLAAAAHFSIVATTLHDTSSATTSSRYLHLSGEEHDNGSHLVLHRLPRRCVGFRERITRGFPFRFSGHAQVI